jgi:hypothetical protein
MHVYSTCPRNPKKGAIVSTETPNRSCGSCGAPVDASDVTCPRCDALLAAYEAPQGSSPVHDAITEAPAIPTDQVPAQNRRPSQTVTPPATTAEATLAQAVQTALSRGAASTAPTNAPSEPEPAITVARADLVSTLTNHQKGRDVSIRATRTNLVSVLKSREAAIRSSTRAPSRTGRAPRRVTPVRHPATRAEAPPSREITSRTASFAKLALGVLMILVVMGILDFNLIPVLVLGVVLLSMLGIMRSAARASGRKTTTMHDPKRRDTRRR